MCCFDGGALLARRILRKGTTPPCPSFFFLHKFERTLDARFHNNFKFASRQKDAHHPYEKHSTWNAQSLRVLAKPTRVTRQAKPKRISRRRNCLKTNDMRTLWSGLIASRSKQCTCSLFGKHGGTRPSHPPNFQSGADRSEQPAVRRGIAAPSSQLHCGWLSSFGLQSFGHPREFR
jgi:hypothetical protein